MFGYIKTDNPNMYVKDTVLYRSIYCGLCKSIGKNCGLKGRLVLNYDMAFLSAFIHNITNTDININKEHCITHWIKKRPVSNVDDLSIRLGALNVILAYYKLSDDILDSKKGKIKKSFFNKPYKRAKKSEPVLDEIVKKYYHKLYEYENSNGDSIDVASDYFASLTRDIVKELTGEFYTETVGKLSYQLGKWIYLIDALDDFDKDKKNKEYNVFVNTYKSMENAKELLNKNYSEIQTIFAVILSDINDCSSKINYYFNHDLIDNVLNFGLIKETKRIMEKLSCTNTTKS